MASSSKVMFKLETLKKQAIKSIDERIRQTEQEVASYSDDEQLRLRIAEWRTRQEKRVADLHKRLRQSGSIGDHELARWSIEEIPSVDRWDRQRAERNLRELQSRKTQILAKGESLVPDAEGNVSLTKTQLSEFFSL